jgi:hypothetical protein
VLGANDFQRDGPVQALVDAVVDVAHAALAEDAEDTDIADAGTDHEIAELKLSQQGEAGREGIPTRCLVA